MTRGLIMLLILAGCATKAPPVVVEPRGIVVTPYSPVPGVVDDAVNAQRDAAHKAETRDDLTAPELLRMLKLSHAVQRAVRRVRGRRTPANVEAARGAIRSLRGFTNEGKSR